MKKTFNILLICGLFALALVSCTKNNPLSDESKKREETFQKISETFLEKTVYPTYSNLADKTEELVDDLTQLKSSRNQTDLDKACKTFLAARAEWELSEAFLVGAATDFGIDPHIDSWPLDEDSFNDLMASPNLLKNLEGEGGAEYAGAKLGNELLGFHGIEFILFEDGQPKNISKISDNHLTYATAVAGDLMNRTAQLDVAWRGESAPAERRELMEELELPVTISGSNHSYGENLLLAGEAGSLLKSKTHAMQYILSACSNIVDEVGTSKIGKAHNGEDVSYIESPYSQNSITDFYDNLISVANVYYGGRSDIRNTQNSLQHYFKENAPEIEAEFTSALTNALEKVKAMKAPFVKNFTDKSAKEAIEACVRLNEAIENAKTSIAQ